MSKVRVIIQCRLSSSRLPAKALLPLGGIPFICLVALRAANTGLEVIVATSTDSSDDILVNELEKTNIKYMRGHLNNVLERFVAATIDLNDKDIVVRLTGDNVFPDGTFVEELIAKFKEQEIDFLGTSFPDDGLPYGLSAEAFNVKLLREAQGKASTDYEKEHVTPLMKKNCVKKIFKPQNICGDQSYLRCTLDTFEDYLDLTKFFSSVQDPITVSWYKLCEELEHQQAMSATGSLSSHRKLVLGGAQLGMHYGRTNKTGKPSFDAAKLLVKNAIRAGVLYIDTAQSYGDSEHIIGSALSSGLGQRACVITKLESQAHLNACGMEEYVQKFVEAGIFKSCRNLQQNKLEVVLLHDANDYGSLAWNCLLSLKADGVIGALGASVYTPQEALAVIDDPNIEYLQIPFNILDWRWRISGFIERIFEKKNLTIHVRSSLLQGILPASYEYWPQIKNFNTMHCIKTLQQLCNEFNRVSIVDLCFAYLSAQSWIAGIVVGMESLAQLNENMRLFQKAPLTISQCERINTLFVNIPETLLNPSLWNLQE